MKLKSIIKPETTYEIIGKHGTIKHVGIDLEVACTGNVLVRGEVSYRIDTEVYKSLV